MPLLSHRTAVALIGLALSASCMNDAEQAQDETLDDASSALADTVDPRCTAAFTDADRASILAAIQASDMAPRERVSHALNRFGYGDRVAATPLPSDTATTLASAIYTSLRNGPSIAATARAAMDTALGIIEAHVANATENPSAPRN